MDEPSDGEGTIFISIERTKSSDGKTRKTKPIKIDLTKGDSSQEDSLDKTLTNLRKQETPKKSLKRKREETHEQRSDDSISIQSFESSQGSERSGSYESGEEDSFIADGEHYGSDEEDPFVTEISYSCSHDDMAMSSSGDEYEPETKSSKTKIKNSKPRHSKRLQPAPKKKRFKPLLSSSSSSQGIEDEPDEEMGDESLLPLDNGPDFMKEMVKIGLHIKLLSNVYLGNVSKKANVFLPWYKATIELPDGQTETHEGWFKTGKQEICVFASGGLHHIWEKNVRHVNGIFFGEKIKIIRAHWIQKHPYQDTHETTLEEDFSGENQKNLHSEYYYDLFFQQYFLPQLKEKVKNSAGTLKDLTIHAFSWWDVCNMCEGTLSGHRKLLGPGVSLSYQIAACNPYTHQYPQTSCVENKRIPAKVERKAWKDLWEKIEYYTELEFERSKDKRKFWTKKYKGLEVCKWFGQAFSEREIRSDGRWMEEKEKSILTFYKEQRPHKAEALDELLEYLREQNWDLSCWYKGPYVDDIQNSWKKHWKQVCIPHFGWEEVHSIEKKKEEGDKRRGRRKLQDRQIVEFEDRKDWNGDCEMCGYKGIEKVSRIFHPKYEVSENFLTLPENEQQEREGSYGFTYETPIDHLPSHLQKKRLQSLCVGSECVKFLLLQKSDIDEWRERHPYKETDSKTYAQATRMDEEDVLFNIEKEFKPKKKKSKRTRSS
jgi:hypothetical protein